jgi:large subunit ribosomal protein L18
MIKREKTREGMRRIRHRRIRKRVVGLPGRPRLAIFRSHQHLYAQLVDDTAGRSLCGWSTKDDRLGASARGGTVQTAGTLGALIASDATQRGVTSIVVDRGGYPYHGRVKALVEAVRAGGIQG